MYSIVFCVNLEVSLRMGTDGADFRRGSADHDMAAVPALPDLDLALPEDLLGLHVFQKGPVALLVVLLNLTDRPKFRSQLRKALCLGGLGEA